MNRFSVCAALCAVAVACLGITGRAAASPWATSVVAYDYDGDGNPADDKTTLNHPEVALGEPTRLVAPTSGYPGVAGFFNGPYMSNEIVQIKSGGQLIVGFDQPIVHDLSHPFGVDLIVFGHAMFSDASWPNGEFSATPALFGAAHAGQIDVSDDGTDWRTVTGVQANMLFPTLGYLDSGPYDTTPGSVLTNFQIPVNPALQMSDFAGLSYAQAVALYNGSGGGTPVDISSTGLSEVRYVRITAAPGSPSVEIDAFAAVPEPASLLLLCVAGLSLRKRRL